MALDYLDMCKRLAGVATPKTMQAHVRYIIEFQWYVLDLEVGRRSKRRGCDDDQQRASSVVFEISARPKRV